MMNRGLFPIKPSISLTASNSQEIMAKLIYLSNRENFVSYNLGLACKYSRL